MPYLLKLQFFYLSNLTNFEGEICKYQIFKIFQVPVKRYPSPGIFVFHLTTFEVSIIFNFLSQNLKLTGREIKLTTISKFNQVNLVLMHEGRFTETL